MPNFKPELKVDDPTTLIGHMLPASDEDAAAVLFAPQGEDEGRSDFRWIVLANGDVCLAVFPLGELYERLCAKGAF